MGINRYDKAPEWNPGVLPYELILKAADMTQQRWDKAKASGDELANELFKSVKVVPRSQDEQVVLPGVMKEYQDMSTRLSNDPDMNPTKYQMEVGNFVNRNKSLLNRMTNLANLYQAGVTTKAGNMQDPKFRADNTYFDHTQTDFTKIDSRTQDPWEDQIGFKATQNYNPYISSNLLNEWVGTMMELKTDPTTGAVSSISGKDIDNLAEKATAASSNYVTSENFQDHITSGRLDGMRPDDFLYPIGNKSYFGNKTMAELTPLEQSKAMIMLTGVEQLNTKGMLTKGTSGGVSGGGITKAQSTVMDPWPLFYKSNTLYTQDIADATNSRVVDGGILQTVKKGASARPGMFMGDPEADRVSAMVSVVGNVLNNNNINGMLGKILSRQTSIKDAEKRSTEKNRDPKTIAEDDAILASGKDQLEANILELGETLEKMKSQPGYLEAAAMLSEMNYVVSSPREMAVAYADLIKKEQEYKDSMNPEQKEILNMFNITFDDADTQAVVSYTEDNNVIELGSTKAIKGVRILGKEEDVLKKLDDKNDGFIDLDFSDNALWVGELGYDSIFGDGNSIDKAFPGMFVKVPVTRTVDGKEVVTDMIGINTYQAINMYDAKMKDNWNSTRLQGKTNEENRQAFMLNAVDEFIADKVDRTLDIFTKNPLHEKSYRMNLAARIATMPENLKKIVDPMFEVAKTDKQTLAYLYQTIVQFGNNHEKLLEYLKNADEVNNSIVDPTQPQGQGGPLGGLQH